MKQKVWFAVRQPVSLAGMVSDGQWRERLMTFRVGESVGDLNA